MDAPRNDQGRVRAEAPPRLPNAASDPASRTERLELTTFLRNATTPVRPRLESAGHPLIVTVPSQLTYLDAEATRMTEVFASVLQRTLETSSEGERIWLSAEREGRTVVVHVRRGQKLGEANELVVSLPALATTSD